MVRNVFLRVEFFGVYDEDCVKDEICDVKSHIYYGSAYHKSKEVKKHEAK